MGRLQLLDDFAWVTETAIKGDVNVLRRPRIALSFQADPIVSCYRESWRDLQFSQRLEGRWYQDRHQMGAGYTHRLEHAIVPQSNGGFALLAEGLADQLGANARQMTLVGPIGDFIDADRDGVPLRFEQAFAMNPAVKDRDLLPQMFTSNGETSFVVRKTNGGSFSVNSSEYFTDDWRIWTEISDDLQSWSSATDAVQRVDTIAVNNIRVSFYEPVDSSQRKAFFRVRVERR